MPRSRWIALAAVPVLVALAAWVAPAVVGAGGDASRETATNESEEDGPTADLVGVEVRADDTPESATTDDVVTPVETDRARVSAAPPPPKPKLTDDTAKSESLVMGVVTDADGVPFPGVKVTLSGQGDVVFFSEIGDLSATQELPDNAAFVDPTPRSVVTDTKGAFVFENSRTDRGGTLAYGDGILLGDPLRAKIDDETDWQVLRLPRFPRQDALWSIEVVDSDDRPLVIESADLELVKLGPDAGPARAPWPGERVVTLGSIVQRGLARGTWRMTVTPEQALTTSVEWTVAAEDAAETTRIVVDVSDGAYAQDTGPTLDADGKSWVDPASGLLDWLPESRVSVGEDALNRHFAQTLTFGPGEVRSAQLTLRLRAMLFNADNDALYLEHRGVRDFVWRARIDDLVRPSWKKGATATLRLDLSRLPRKGEKPLDLRPYLEDGMLDVVVQDDTTIDDVSIRVIR